MEKGNLIVIPRANFHSIIENQRFIQEDMNRKFTPENGSDIESQIVDIIQQEMSQADLFLNLHDGWGFYNDTYIDRNRNPHRFGQSLISDTDIYIANGDTLQLAEMARQVLEKVNQKIEDPLHRIHFMNTRTFDEESNFPEMQRSATYYALTQFGIPAFGIEASKNLRSLDQKIRYHNYVINEFMKLFNVIPEHPAVIYEPPQLIYILVSINNSTPKVIDSGGALQVIKGDRIRIVHVEANYTRGLSCDIEGAGNSQDFEREVAISEPTHITIKKDHQVIGNIPVRLEKIQPEMMTYIFEVNGEKRAILHSQTLSVQRGDRLQIIDVSLHKIDPQHVTVNLKGYVPPTDYNTGEDRNYEIDTGLLTWKKYSLHGVGDIYPIIVSNGTQEISRCYLSIE